MAREDVDIGADTFHPRFYSAAKAEPERLIDRCSECRLQASRAAGKKFLRQFSAQRSNQSPFDRAWSQIFLVIPTKGGMSSGAFTSFHGQG